MAAALDADAMPPVQSRVRSRRVRNYTKTGCPVTVDAVTSFGGPAGVRSGTVELVHALACGHASPVDTS
eukprot:4189776-Pleurochrysis_carterae.AAC.2